MPQFLKQYGERLVELGYRIVPIPPGRKGPNRKGWPAFAPDADQVRQWYTNGSAHDGIGVIAANTPAIDVDILDPEVAQQMSDAIDAIFPDAALMTRTGMAPKFLVPFRSDEPFRKMSSSTYTDGTHEHKVEILGDGQQWVAYHIHPQTGRPYDWWDGVADAGISATARELLPRLARDDARRVIDAFELLAAGRVASGRWTARVSVVPAEKAGGAHEGDPFAAQPTNLTRAQIEWLVHKSDPTDYEEWIDVGMRLHHQYAGEDEGLEIWDAWSANSHKYSAEVMQPHWDSFGHRADAPKTLRGLLDKHGQPPKEEHKPRADGSANPFAVHEWASYKQNYLSTPWIIKGVLPQAEVGILYGQSGSGKTFFVLDMAACIARGAEWRGRKVSNCRVVYVAAEAREGIKKRMDAYDQHVCADGARPDIIASAPNLLSTDTKQLIEAVGSAGLIILDTMAASHSGDENSAKDMGLFLAACKDISLATGAMVLAVHHTGKEESKGMRGSSALFAGADFVMEVFKNEKEHGAMLSKSRDDITGTSFGFVLRRVVVGQDEEGDEVTTCVVEPIQKDVSKAAKRPKKLANLDDARYDMHREMLTIFEKMADDSLSGLVDGAAVVAAVQKKYPSKLKKNLAVVLLKLASMGAIAETPEGYRIAEDDLSLG